MDDPYKNVAVLGGTDDPFKGLKAVTNKERLRQDVERRALLTKTRGAAIEQEYQNLVKEWKTGREIAPGVRGNTNRWGRHVLEPLLPQDVTFLRTIAKKKVEMQDADIITGNTSGARIGRQSDYQERQSNIQFAQARARQEAILRRSGAMGKGPKAVQDLNDMQAKVKEVLQPITPYVRKFGELTVENTILGRTVPGYKEFFGSAAAELPEQVLLAPMRTIKTWEEVTDPNVSPENKLRSVGDFGLNVVSLFSLGVDDVAKGLSWVLFKIGTKSAKAEMAAASMIRQAMEAGVSQSAIESYMLERMAAGGKRVEGTGIVAGTSKSPPIAPPQPRVPLPTGGKAPFGPAILARPKAGVVDVPPTTAIDVTEEVASRRALPAPQRRFQPEALPGYESGATPEIAKQAFINRNWRERTQGLIKDVDELIATQKGAGREYGPLKRELAKSLDSGTPHPAVQAELDEIWKSQTAKPKPVKVTAAAKKEPINASQVKQPKEAAARVVPEQVQGEGVGPSRIAKQAEVQEATPALPGRAKPDPIQAEAPKFKVETQAEAPIQTRQVKPPVVPAGAKKSQATTPNLKRTINTEEQLVEMDDLIASHDTKGAANPEFPQTIQNRDRGRTSALDQARERAANLDASALIDDFRSTDRGSPIVGAGNEVISGNGRVMSLRLAKEQFGPKYEAYRKALTERFPEAANMENPVLVRRVVDDLDEASRKELAEASNEASVARMSPYEEAANDSRHVPDDFADRFKMRGKTLEVALNSPENAGLVKSIVDRLPDNEKAGLFDSSGTLSEPGRGRVARAILHKIFGDDAKGILEKAFEEGDFSKRIMGGLEQAAGDLGQLSKPGNPVASEMRSRLADALRLADEAMSQTKMSAKAWFDQGSLEYRDPGAMAIAKALVEAKSKEQVANIVGKLARAADDSSGGMFMDELGYASADDAINAVLGADAPGMAGLFPDVDALTEASRVYGGGVPGQLSMVALPDPSGPLEALWMAARRGKTLKGIKDFFVQYMGNAFDRVRQAGPSGKRIAQDMERVLTESAARTANYGIRLKEVIRANFGKLPGLNPDARRSLGLTDEFNDMVSKVERGEKLTAKEARVWKVWVDINEDLAKLGEQKGVMIERLVGASDYKDLVGRRISFFRDDLTRTGILETVEPSGNMIVRTAEGRVRLRNGEAFWSGSLVDPQMFFPRELKAGIMERLMDDASEETYKAIEHLIAKGLAKDEAHARRILREIMFPGDITVESPVKSRLRMPRTGKLLPDEFYDRNFAKVAEKHIARASLDLAMTETWGAQSAQLMELLKGIPMAARKETLEIIKTGVGAEFPRAATKLIAAEGAYQAFTKLSGIQTAIIQGSQLASNVAVLGPKATVKGLWDVVKSAVTNRKLINEIKLSGVIDEDILALQGFEDVGGVAKGAVNMALSPMKFIDGKLRLVSARSGLAAAKDLLQKIKVNGKTIEKNAAYRSLSEWFQYTDEDILRMKAKGMSQSDRLLAMRGGVKTQITTRAADIPYHVNQMPALRMLWRFKTFSYGQAKLFSWAVKEVGRGNAVPLMRMAVAAAVIGEGIVSAKQAFIQWATGVESKRKTLKEDLDKGWEAIAKRAWDNVVETGTFGLYTSAWEMVAPGSPPYKKQLAFPAASSIATLLDSIAYGSKTEGEFLQKLEAAGMSFSDKEIVIFRQAYKRLHEGKTYRQENPAEPKEDEEE